MDKPFSISRLRDFGGQSWKSERPKDRPPTLPTKKMNRKDTSGRTVVTSLQGFKELLAKGLYWE